MINRRKMDPVLNCNGNFRNVDIQLLDDATLERDSIEVACDCVSGGRRWS